MDSRQIQTVLTRIDYSVTDIYLVQSDQPSKKEHKQ